MANPEQLKILEQGVDIWNKWREENPTLVINLIKADLRNANLRSAYLMEANLSYSNLIGADLRYAGLMGADLKYADANGANLSEAYLGNTDLHDIGLSGANLTKAYLAEANLRAGLLGGVNFSAANLYHTDLSVASIGNTILGDIDLSETLGLESVEHTAPSTLGTNTLLLSRGKIPEVFLRGCGLRDWEIEAAKLYDPNLSNYDIDETLYRVQQIRISQPIQISPLFISYSHSDKDFVDKLEGELNKQGIRYWRDVHNAVAGPLETQIDRAISQNPTVLLILSENSIKSDWVQHEARKAREIEKYVGRPVLCPVALDDSWKTSPWPERIMEQVLENNILDFSKWNDNSYFKNMFVKLIDGLNMYYKKQEGIINGQSKTN